MRKGSLSGSRARDIREAEAHAPGLKRRTGHMIRDDDPARCTNCGRRKRGWLKGGRP